MKGKLTRNCFFFLDTPLQGDGDGDEDVDGDGDGDWGKSGGHEVEKWVFGEQH